MLQSNHHMLLVFLLFVGIFLISLIPFGHGVTADTFTVDDDGGEDFETIQDAIDNAKDGDTIEVANGTYAENVIVTKELVIRSKTGNTGDVIIDADHTGDAAVAISSNNVTLTGVTLRNATEFHTAAVALDTVEGCVVSNCIIERSYYGLSDLDGTGNTVIYCEVRNNDDSGIRFDGTRESWITQNSIHSNEFDGVLMIGSHGNTIAYNLIQYNLDSGIKLYGSHNNSIEENAFASNGGEGMDPQFANGIYLSNSNGNTFTGNMVSGSGNFDFYSEEDSGNNQIERLILHNYSATISFTFGNGIAVKSVSVAPPSPPAGRSTIDTYVNITSLTEDSWINLTFLYNTTDVLGLDETTLRVWRYHDDWSEVPGSYVDTDENVVAANITEFSIFAPAGSPPEQNSQPEVDIISPTQYSIVSGILTIQGTSWDQDGNETVQLVEYSLNSVDWTAANGTTNWSFLWDSRTVVNGQVIFDIRAFDGIIFSSTHHLYLNVFNAPPDNSEPVVEITSPVNGTVVLGTVNITGTSSDEDGNETIQKVQLNVDNGVWLIVTGTSTWSIELDTTTLSNGNHSIKVQAFDPYTMSDIKGIHIDVRNPLPPNMKPVVNIISPANGTMITERTTIIGNASDQDGNITKVEISIHDEGWITVNGLTSWNYIWDIIEIFAGNYTIRVRAYDGEDYSDVIVWELRVSKGPGSTSEEDEKSSSFLPGPDMLTVIVSIGIVLVLVTWKRRY